MQDPLQRENENGVWHIGPCRFIPNQHLLLREGISVRLPKRQSQLLLRLVEAAPNAISRQTLIDEVWQRRFVEDDVLSRAIAELRRALGDESRQSRFIETIPKSGYRLCADCAWVATSSATHLTPAHSDPPYSPPLNSPPLNSSTLESVPLESLQLEPGPRVEPTNVAASPYKNSMRLLLGVLLLLTLGLFGALMMWRHLKSVQTAEISLDITPNTLVTSRPLTSASGWEYAASINADGTLIAHVERADIGGKLARSSVIVLTDTRGQSRRVIVSEPGWSVWPALSPNGTLLAYLHRDTDQGCELRILRLLDLSEKLVIPCANDSDSAPAWSPDQGTLVYQSPAAANRATGLSHLNLKDGTTHRLTSPTLAEGKDSGPKFHPTQNAVSFTRGRESERNILLIEFPSGKILRELVAGRNRIHGHAWRQDAKQLVFASDAIGYRALMSLDLASKRVSMLGARGARYPSLSGTGVLVYDMAHYDANIWQMDLRDSTKAPRRVTHSNRYDANPVLSPDESILAFVSNRLDNETVFIAKPDGTEERAIDAPEGTRWTRPDFSPDSKALLLSTYQSDSSNAVYLYSLESRQLHKLAHLGSNADAAKFTFDGNHIVYLRRDNKQRTSLWIASADPLGKNPPRMVPGSEGVDHFFLRDGRVIVQRLSNPGFEELDLWMNRPARQLLTSVQVADEFTWLVRAHTLYAVVRENKSMQLAAGDLVAFDLNTGARKVLAGRVDASAVGAAIAINHDESRLWFARTDDLSLDLMIMDGQSISIQ